MDLNVLNIPIAKVNQFNDNGIYSVEDLVKFIPKKYRDFRDITSISKIENGQVCAIVGTILKIYEKKEKRYVGSLIKDKHGDTMFVSWFNKYNIAKELFVGGNFIFCGKVKVEEKNNKLSRNMVNPFRFGANISEHMGIFPVYKTIRSKPKMDGAKSITMSEDYFNKCMKLSIPLANKEDYLESKLLYDFNLVKQSDSLKMIHYPKSEREYAIAKTRLIFDDLLKYNIKLILNQSNVLNQTNFKMKPIGNIVKQFLKELPFDLTDGQNDSLKTIYSKMSSGKRLNALVQGDVSTGKTMVAILSLVYAYENRYQSVLMCPRTVLAQQHYEEIVNRTKALGCKVALLTGETKSKERKRILKDLESGQIDILVGTHAITSEKVVFKKLALTVCDEEHKFGVLQREFLEKKNEEGAHNITMSATPIPRSLALSLYGNNIDVLTIKTMPKGRKAIKTYLFNDNKRIYDFMLKEIKNGHQCYVICPYAENDITYDDSSNDNKINSVDETYKELVEYYKDYTDINIEKISGKMKQSEVFEKTEKFKENKAQILISTTIVEVGINVPNATVILIKNAERFGLSTLHQLRGRVGRGQQQSYCILSSQKKDRKLEVMCETNDGFIIAEEDLKIRGAGDFIGTQQSGNNKDVMLMLAYPEFNNKVKEEVLKIYMDKIRLERYKRALSIN